MEGKLHNRGVGDWVTEAGTRSGTSRGRGPGEGPEHDSQRCACHALRTWFSVGPLPDR
jgi:hypothetical protein